VCDDDGQLECEPFSAEIVPLLSQANHSNVLAKYFFSKCRFKHLIGFWEHFSKFHTEFGVITIMNMCTQNIDLLTADTKQ
jgi:hypothetical protein